MAATALALNLVDADIVVRAADLPVPFVTAPQILPKAIERPLPLPLVPSVDHVWTPPSQKLDGASEPKLPKMPVDVTPPVPPSVTPWQGSEPGSSNAIFWAALLMLGLLGLLVVRLVEAIFSRKPAPLETLAYRSIARQRRPSEDELLGALFDTLNGRSGPDLEMARQRVRQLASEISNLNRSNNRS